MNAEDILDELVDLDRFDVGEGDEGGGHMVRYHDASPHGDWIKSDDVDDLINRIRTAVQLPTEDGQCCNRPDQPDGEGELWECDRCGGPLPLIDDCPSCPPIESLPVAAFVCEELTHRGWSVCYAASLLPGDAAQNLLWMQILSCPELWESRSIEFTREDAAKLEAIFDISAETWSDMHRTFLEAKAVE